VITFCAEATPAIEANIAKVAADLAGFIFYSLGLTVAPKAATALILGEL
jgi:hypothetical protein